VIVVALLNLLKQRRRVLVCAPTNSAIVYVVECLLADLAVEQHERILLVGDEDRMEMSERVARRSLDTILRERDQERDENAAADFIRRAQLVFCTVSSSGRRRMTMASATRFDLLIFDEACQVGIETVSCSEGY
jgi:superfamily II DNA or RNA helicase